MHKELWTAITYDIPNGCSSPAKLEERKKVIPSVFDPGDPGWETNFALLRPSNLIIVAWRENIMQLLRLSHLCIEMLYKIDNYSGIKNPIQKQNKQF